MLYDMLCHLFFVQCLFSWFAFLDLNWILYAFRNNTCRCWGERWIYLQWCIWWCRWSVITLFIILKEVAIHRCDLILKSVFKNLLSSTIFFLCKKQPHGKENRWHKSRLKSRSLWEMPGEMCLFIFWLMKLQLYKDNDGITGNIHIYVHTYIQRVLIDVHNLLLSLFLPLLTTLWRRDPYCG